MRIFQCVTKYPCNKTGYRKKNYIVKIYRTKKKKKKKKIKRLILKTQKDLELESLEARGDGALRVIVHNVSAALACTSEGFCDDETKN
ncbi:hypothetical protein HanRHA438_Chr02g0093431 [Helianthus annuus]|nr:hypothetical protein HanRHA438_Chr02g0093431 [Helianthus annuus]